MNIEPFHLFTHKGCLDGAASAILFRNAGGLEQNVHFVNAGRVEEEIRDSTAINDPNTPVLMVDISPSTLDFARFLIERGNVWIIDHHGTATWLNGMSPNFFVDINNDACGCENFRQWLTGNGPEHMKKNAYRRFTEIVDDHDRWQMKIPISLKLPKLMSFVGQTEFVDAWLDIEDRFINDHVTCFTEFEEELLGVVEHNQMRSFRTTNDKMQVRDVVMLGKPVKAGYVISDELNNSEMLNLYLNEHTDVDVAVQISFGLQKISMRSNGRVDVAEVCKQFGGGGHKNAAGHPLPKGLIFDIIERVHGKIR